MFKFNFLESELGDVHETEELGKCEQSTLRGSVEVPLDDLIKALPSVLSYSPISVPLTTRLRSENSTPEPVLTFAKRDLYDAKFQLMSDNESFEDADHEQVASQEDRRTDAISFLHQPSDLVPGVYEGGLKTWECSLDLIDYLECTTKREQSYGDWVKGKSVLEIGCGTAIPSLFLLGEVFSRSTDQNSRQTSTKETLFDVQDYNRAVLELVTFPNVLLTWYMSPLSIEYRTKNETEIDHEPASSIPGDLDITPALISSFLASLREQNITLRFFCGSWEGLWQLLQPTASSPRPYDIILTSETIYRTESVPSLIRLLKSSCGVYSGDPSNQGSSTNETTANLESQASRLSLDPIGCSSESAPLCLVAAKVLYFGVGGGVATFERMIGDSAGVAQTVLERNIGVGRKVMRLSWS